jgi:hypothetical protein
MNFNLHGIVPCTYPPPLLPPSIFIRFPVAINHQWIKKYQIMPV